MIHVDDDVYSGVVVNTKGGSRTRNVMKADQWGTRGTRDARIGKRSGLLIFTKYNPAVIILL